MKLFSAGKPLVTNGLDAQPKIVGRIMKLLENNEDF